MGGSYCACACGSKVAEVGHYRKACRLRIEASGGYCARNVQSAAKKRLNLKHNPKNNPIRNPVNNPKNNPKNNKKKQLALRAANLQAVLDDPTLDKTLTMTTGMSARVCDQAHTTHSLESPDSPAHSID